MIEGIPLWVVLLDYLLGMVMWTLIGRFGMGLFLPADSRFFFSRFFIRRRTFPVGGFLVGRPKVAGINERMLLTSRA